MTQAWDDIREIDLMAYADGLLDDDAPRKAAVEAYLAAHPQQAERVDAIIRDNREIREFYADELREPVPKRLLRAVHQPPRRQLRLPQAVAAGILLVSLAAGAGWFVGQRDNDLMAKAPAELLNAIAERHVARQKLGAAGQHASQVAGGALLSAASNKIHIEIPLPDLSAHGFNLADRTRVVAAGQNAMQLVYRAPDTTLNLFMWVRREPRSSSPSSQRIGDRLIHYWTAGPLGYAMTTDTGEDDAHWLAAMVHGAIQQGRLLELSPPTTADPANGGQAVVGDGTQVGKQDSPAAPLSRRQFN